MCDHHGPIREHGIAHLPHWPALSRLSLGRTDETTLRRFALCFQAMLISGPLAHRRASSAIQRLAYCREIVFALLRATHDRQDATAASRILLEGLMQRCGEHERRHWLECACMAMSRSGMAPDAKLQLWRWLETLSLHMLHRRAARMAMVRYLHPLAGVPRLDTPQLDRPQALEYREQTQ